MGANVIDLLSHDLRQAFPDLGGFSRANLKYMRAFATAWSDDAIGQQAVGQLPWGHNIVLLTKLKDPDLRLAYAEAALEFGWSRNVLAMHVDRKRIERPGKAVTNFERSLPKPDSDLARESLKDPYRLDFLGLGDEAHEREIESSLTSHITEFLLELGAGFAFVGRQVHLGQLGFSMTAVDDLMRHESDGQTIGLLLCRTKNEAVAEYALRDNTQPLGIAQYQLMQALPDSLQTALPTIEQIERELGDASE